MTSNAILHGGAEPSDHVDKCMRRHDASVLPSRPRTQGDGCAQPFRSDAKDSTSASHLAIATYVAAIGSCVTQSNGMMAKSFGCGPARRAGSRSSHARAMGHRMSRGCRDEATRRAARPRHATSSCDATASGDCSLSCFALRSRTSRAPLAASMRSRGSKVISVGSRRSSRAIPLTRRRVVAPCG